MAESGVLWNEASLVKTFDHLTPQYNNHVALPTCHKVVGAFHCILPEIYPCDVFLLHLFHILSCRRVDD